MGVTKPGLEPGDCLAAAGQADMRGWLDAAMNRPERDLIQVVVRDRQELRGFAPPVQIVGPQCHRVRLRPTAMVEPRSLIGPASRRVTPEVLHHALEPGGQGAVGRQRGIQAGLNLGRCQQRLDGRLVVQEGVHMSRVGPQSQQREGRFIR